jgi:hypothetical protein
MTPRLDRGRHETAVTARNLVQRRALRGPATPHQQGQSRTYSLLDRAHGPGLVSTGEPSGRDVPVLDRALLAPRQDRESSLLFSAFGSASVPSVGLHVASTCQPN